MFHVDAIDRRILMALQRNGALSSQALAEQVGASAASCWRRVKALEDVGILGPAVRLVDAAKLGRALEVFCQIRMKSQSGEKRAAFEAFIAGQDDVTECYSISGEWDYILHITVRDVADYERVLMHGILAHEAIASSSSIFVLRRVKHSTVIPI